MVLPAVDIDGPRMSHARTALLYVWALVANAAAHAAPALAEPIRSDHRGTLLFFILRHIKKKSIPDFFNMEK